MLTGDHAYFVRFLICLFRPAFTAAVNYQKKPYVHIFSQIHKHGILFVIKSFTQSLSVKVIKFPLKIFVELALLNVRFGRTKS